MLLSVIIYTMNIFKSLMKEIRKTIFFVIVKAKLSSYIKTNFKENFQNKNKFLA